VAYKRFVDNVPKAIDEQLVLGIARGLQDALATGLGYDSHHAHERYAKLLAEPPRMAEKREKLFAHQKRLLAAQDELRLRIPMYLDYTIRDHCLFPLWR
jgi:hypothetical protein